GNSTFIAHNGAKYDMHFLKRAFIRRRLKVRDVANGNTYYSISLTRKKKTLRFIDSYKFIPIPLRNFGKAFGFTHVCKGYFPYRFLTERTLDYKGRMPGIEWFDFGKL